MSIHIIFLKKHEQYAAKSSHIVKRSVGKNLIDSGVAVPFTVYQRMVAEKAEVKAKVEAEEKEKAEAKAKEEAEKAEKLLKDKEAKENEEAVSKKTNTRSKAVRK